MSQDIKKPATEPSAEAKEAAQKARVRITECQCAQCRDVIVRNWALALDAYAASRARSYAIEQLRDVAELMCYWCAKSYPLDEYRRHEVNDEPMRCAVPVPLWDRIRLLRDQGTGE